MKIAISCLSPLVQSSLMYYLKDYLVEEEDCEFLITDDENRVSPKPLCLVVEGEHSHIHKPFSAQSLHLDIEAFYKNLPETPLSLPQESVRNFEPPMSPPIYPKNKSVLIESQIRALCDSYAKELADKLIALLKNP